MAKFDDWFLAQYGDRPVSCSNEELLRKIENLKGELHQWSALADMLLEWEHARDAALKAWVARESQE